MSAVTKGLRRSTSRAAAHRAAPKSAAKRRSSAQNKASKSNQSCPAEIGDKESGKIEIHSEKQALIQENPKEDGTS